MSLKLVIFDVDGTLVDSQGDIHACMVKAFEAERQPGPSRAAVRSIVGLSLPQAVFKLAPDLDPALRERIVASYKLAYADARRKQGAAQSSPLFEGARAALEALFAREEYVLAVATGKSRRGLDFLMEAHGLAHLFASTQVADDHPSKPHPSMVLTALAETGVSAEAAVVIGDTSYDMDMAKAAQVPFVGVSWGYHAPEAFDGALGVLDRFANLPGLLDAHWSAK